MTNSDWAIPTGYMNDIDRIRKLREYAINGANPDCDASLSLEGVYKLKQDVKDVEFERSWGLAVEQFNKRASLLKENVS